jgi:hypothetical protein
LNAEPREHRRDRVSSVAARSARLIISGVTDVSSSEVRLHQLVVVVGDRVDQLVVVLLRLLQSSAGISRCPWFVPRSSAQVIARISTRSTTPR